MRQVLLAMGFLTVISIAKGYIFISVLVFCLTLLGVLESDKTIWGRVVNVLLANRACRYLGKISYSFYCCHMVAIFLSVYLLLNVFLVTDRLIYMIALISLSSFLSGLFSILLNRLIEEPAIAFGKALTQPRVFQKTI